MKRLLLPVFILLMSACIAKKAPEQEIVRHDRPGAPILRGVFVPEGKDLFYTSGLVASIKDSTATPESYQRYGNTYEQSISTMKNIESTLALSGFSLDDVIQLRIYLAPGADGKIDWKGWFDAYQEFFNNEKRALKVARTTLAVHSLARPDVLVEIEAVAAR